jgi:hypothetical protein
MTESTTTKAAEAKCDRCGANEVKAIVHSPASMPPMNMEEFIAAKGTFISENLCDACMMDQCDEWDRSEVVGAKERAATCAKAYVASNQEVVNGHYFGYEESTEAMEKAYRTGWMRGGADNVKMIQEQEFQETFDFMAFMVGLVVGAICAVLGHFAFGVYLP